MASNFDSGDAPAGDHFLIGGDAQRAEGTLFTEGIDGSATRSAATMRSTDFGCVEVPEHRYESDRGVRLRRLWVVHGHGRSDVVQRIMDPSGDREEEVARGDGEKDRK